MRNRSTRKDLELRAAQLIVNRYSRQQLQDGIELIGTDLQATLARRSG